MDQSSSIDKSSKSQQNKGRSNSDNHNQSLNPKAHNVSIKPSINIKCLVCSESHSIYLCDTFRKNQLMRGWNSYVLTNFVLII